MGKIKFSEMAADVVNDYEANKKRSLTDLKARLKLHLTPFFGEARASGITTVDIRKYVTLRQGQGASNGTINRELTTVKRAFSLAIQAGKIMTKPQFPC